MSNSGKSFCCYIQCWYITSIYIHAHRHKEDRHKIYELTVDSKRSRLFLWLSPTIVDSTGVFDGISRWLRFGYSQPAHPSAACWTHGIFRHTSSVVCPLCFVFWTVYQCFTSAMLISVTLRYNFLPFHPCYFGSWRAIHSALKLDVLPFVYGLRRDKLVYSGWRGIW